jgi:hypothetical protein
MLASFFVVCFNTQKKKLQSILLASQTIDNDTEKWNKNLVQGDFRIIIDFFAVFALLSFD